MPVSNLFRMNSCFNHGKIFFRSFLQVSTSARPFVKLMKRDVTVHKLNLYSTHASTVKISSAFLENDQIKVHWQNGESSEFHNIWLRDHCNCTTCLQHDTQQRMVDLVHLPLDIKPKKVAVTGNKLELTWPDGHVTAYDADWLTRHAYNTTAQTRGNQWVEPFLWDKNRILSVELPKVTYQSVMEDAKESYRLSHTIEKYGFAFVHDTPTEISSLENLTQRIGGFVRETNFGRLSEFSNKEMQHADTAYTTEGLGAHTDNTYFTDPAGLQILHCVQHDGSGGESLLVDGFQAAEMLRQRDQKAFDFLSSQKIPFHFKDDTLHFKANGHVIEVDPFTNHLAQIRFNVYDRDVLDCLASDDVLQFYRAFQVFASIVRDPENEFWFKLVPGLCLVAGNWRVMHGRSAFTGLREMHGCYVNKDDFRSHFRPKFEVYKNESLVD